MSTRVPALVHGLIDDAAVFPPGSAPLPEAIVAHREHRAAWYADIVGPLLLPTSLLTDAARLADSDGLLAPGERMSIGVIGDTGVGALGPAVERADERFPIAQVEVAIAKRGEDPQPGLRALLGLLRGWGTIDGYAEVPLTWGLLGALDAIAEARAGGVRVAPKFRTGGLAAELFPTPIELAAVISACRDRDLPFKLTAGLHHAMRYTDPETGFTHHGFLNVLVATVLAADGAEVADVAELLAGTDPVPLVEASRVKRGQRRPLWIGFGSCSIIEPLEDLIRLGVVNGGSE